MARRTKEEIAADEAAAEQASALQVPAERPEDSLDLRTDEQRAADEQIARDYPEKTDDRADDGASPLAEDDPRRPDVAASESGS